MFQTYPKIKQVGHPENTDLFVNPELEVYLEEKIDGANFRFMIDSDGRIIFGSRTQSIGDSDTEIGGNWQRASNFIKEMVTRFCGTDIKHYAGYLFYGEAMIQHTIPYDFASLTPFIGFDILNLHTGKFLNRADKELIFGAMGLPVVHVHGKYKLGDLMPLTDAKVPQSVYYQGQAEGVVIKSDFHDMRAKYVTDKFKESNAEVFGGKDAVPKIGIGNESDLVFKYCTNARIDKMIFTLIDEGVPLEMSMMQELPRRVLIDMYEENWQEILSSNWIIDFKKVRCLVPKRCVAVLKQFITNNALRNGTTDMVGEIQTPEPVPGLNP